MKKLAALLTSLTYDDINQWAGEKIRARGEDCIERVSDLCRTADDELLAWVAGNENYVTLVRFDEEGEHDWLCTCPYEGDGLCKHAVAVILAAARRLKGKGDIPLVNEYDERFPILSDELGDDYDDEGEWPDNDRRDGKRGKENPKVRQLLTGKSREELLAMLLGLAADFPAVERALLESEQLASGQIKPLLESLRREIANLTEEPSWTNHWSGESDIADYSHVHQQFSSLLAAGHADALLELGDELWQQSNKQVEQSDDDGETGDAIADCLDIVVQALPFSSLSKDAQLLWLIDHLLADEYDLLQSAAKMLDDSRYSTEDWRLVTVALAGRAKTEEKDPEPLAFSTFFQRIGLQEYLIAAYRRSGQIDKIEPLMEENVDRLGNYDQLTNLLMNAGELERARQWCIHGFARTVGDQMDMAEDLQKCLRLIATEQQRHEMVAAHRAEEFFYRPGLEGYKELRQAVEKLGFWSEVRAGALAYLATGKRPDPPAPNSDPVLWPLPVPEVSYPTETSRAQYDRFPNRALLIAIAIFEKRCDDIVALYQAMAKEPFGTRNVDEDVAKAVAQTHPDLSLAIWRRLANALIAQVKPKAYAEAGVFLRMMHKVFVETKRQTDWTALLAELRRTHKAKRRLLEVLDSLSGGGKKIIGDKKDG